MGANFIPKPTIDTPFGIKLWPLFSKIFELVVGYPAEEFDFVVGKTPMSTLKETSIFVAIYYTTIFGGRALMQNREPFQLKTLFLIHNFFLTFISAVLLALYVEELLPTISRNGLFYAICNVDGGWTKRLVALYYLTYLTKYLELLDTVFLFLKKKPLTFLHCYHHGATAVLCYTQLIGNTSISWIPITLNLAVHVLMYWYYFQSARGVRIWWKEWITRFQILQFIVDLGFVSFGSYTHFAFTYFPYLPNNGDCAGEEFAAYSGIAVLSSYLLLFISFYLATYKMDGKRPTTRKTLRRMSQAEFVSPQVIANVTSAKATNVKANGVSTRSRKV